MLVMRYGVRLILALALGAALAGCGSVYTYTIENHSQYDLKIQFEGDQEAKPLPKNGSAEKVTKQGKGLGYTLFNALGGKVTTGTWDPQKLPTDDNGLNAFSRGDTHYVFAIKDADLSAPPAN